MNDLKIIGNIGRDPELRYTGQGTPVLSFSLAFNEKMKTGEVKTSWWKVLVWGKSAERYAAAGLHKGQRVIVIGRITIDEWTDKDGAVRRETQIHAYLVYPVMKINTQEPSSSFFPEE